MVIRRAGAGIVVVVVVQTVYLWGGREHMGYGNLFQWCGRLIIQYYYTKYDVLLS